MRGQATKCLEKIKATCKNGKFRGILMGVRTGMSGRAQARKRRRLRQEVVMCIVLAGCILGIVVCGILLVAPQQNGSRGIMEEVELTQKMVDSDNIQELLSEHGVNIGESARIKSLLRDELPAGIFVSTFDITLNKLTVNYKLTERSGSTEEEYRAFWQTDNAQQIVVYNSGALFALVRNLEIIEINVDGYVYPTSIITRTEAEEYFGVSDLADIDTVEEWQRILIDGGVYDEEGRREFLSRFAAFSAE